MMRGRNIEYGNRTEMEHGWGLLAVRTPWNSEGRYRGTRYSPRL